MLAWKQLPHFLAVAREGSFRAGAEALGSTHATTRRQVEALEGRLGIALFQRSRRGVALTEAGRRLMAEALEAERHIGAAESRLRGLGREAAGLVRLASEPLIGQVVLAPILARFAARYPQIDVEVALGDDFEDVAGQAADIALRIAEGVGPGMQARRLFALTVAAFAHRDYLADHLPGAGPGGEGLVRIGAGAQAQGGGGGGRFPGARQRFASADLGLRLELVLAGAGFAMLPVWVEARYPELRRLPGTTRETTRATWLVVNADMARAPRVKPFADDLARALVAACAPGAPVPR